MNISKNIIISYFYIKKTSAIYVAYVSGVERGGEGGGEKEWGFGKVRKRTPAVRPSDPPPTIEKRETLIRPGVMNI